jgi:hypothetical protein
MEKIVDVENEKHLYYLLSLSSTPHLKLNPFHLSPFALY